MLTVGLIKELYFIAHVLQDVYYLKLFKGEGGDRELLVKMTPIGELDVWYQEHHIWREKVEGDTSFFGVESCDTISRIVACIDKGSEWAHYRWRETP